MGKLQDVASFPLVKGKKWIYGERDRSVYSRNHFPLEFPVSADLKNSPAYHTPRTGTAEISFDGASREGPNAELNALPLSSVSHLLSRRQVITAASLQHLNSNQKN